MQSGPELLGLVSEDEPVVALLLQELTLQREDDILDIPEVGDIRDAGDDNLVGGEALVLQSRLNDVFPEISSHSRNTR